ncbi:hypothetical protein [Kribbella sp. NPDC048928]|uniref:hypothetical protein n=1 Tax=Kribbella sp. NPDC048928 TaxID=3364111 RepID=UPI00371C7508
MPRYARRNSPVDGSADSSGSSCSNSASTAGVLPGVQGASPRDGALVAGLAALGISWREALGAVALTALLYWIPAILIGGSALLLRWRGWFTERHPAVEPA